MNKRLIGPVAILLVFLLTSCNPESLRTYLVTYRVTSTCNNLSIVYLDANGDPVNLTGQASGFEESFTAVPGSELSLSGSSNCFTAAFNVTVTIMVDGVNAAEATQLNGATSTYTLP